jgi:excisionase family DNA binding protein
MPYRQPDSTDTGDYTCDQFARRFNYAMSTVRNKVSRGEIPSYKVGTSRRIPAAYVEALAAADNSLGAAVELIVAKWPKLTDEQLDKIAALLRAGTRTVPQRNSRHRAQRAA